MKWCWKGCPSALEWAAATVHDILGEVDFISVGTNDLPQCLRGIQHECGTRGVRYELVVPLFFLSLKPQTETTSSVIASWRNIFSFVLQSPAEGVKIKNTRSPSGITFRPFLMTMISYLCRASLVISHFRTGSSIPHCLILRQIVVRSRPSLRADSD